MDLSQQGKEVVSLDDLAETLEDVLVEKFNFPVEVISLAKYTNCEGKTCYHFEPFLADVVADVEPNSTDTTEIDTIVVPARDEGYEEVLLGDNR